MTAEELQNALFAAIEPLADGAKVIWMRQDAPRPVHDYVGLHLPRLLRESEPEERQAEDDGLTVERQRIHYGVMLDIEYFGGNALTKCWAIQRGLYLAITRQRLGNIALVNTEDPIDTTTLLDQHWEARVRFTAQFRVAVESQVPLEWIQTVNLNRAPEMPGATP